MDRKKVYSEKLRDPRWQKKRLEIFQRDEFFCQICQDNESTLHVHHRRYVAGREPWEADDCDLTTLCEDCHAEEQRLWPIAMENLKAVLCGSGFFSFDVAGLVQTFLSLISFLAKNKEAYELVAQRFHEHVNPNRSEAVTPARTASE